jgi:hypothetical protein
MHSKRKTIVKRASGQGIIEGVCGSIIFVLVFVLLTMLGVNLFTYGVYSQKLQVVANCGAKNFNDGRYWLGEMRPDWNENDARARGEALVNELLPRLGLPPASKIEFTNTVGPNFGYTECTITINGIRLPYGGNAVFPSVLGVTCTGYSADSSYPPYAQLTLVVPPPNDGWSVAAIPAFGFARTSRVNPTQVYTPTKNCPEGKVVPGGVRKDYQVVMDNSATGETTLKCWPTSGGQPYLQPFE